MDEKLKDRIIFVLGLATVLFCVTSISSCVGSYRQKSAKDKEMATRLDLEEKLSKFSQDRALLDKQLAASQSLALQEKALLDENKKALLQEQLISGSLKEELKKVTKLKEALEEDLKEALAKIPKPKTSTTTTMK